MGQWSPRFRSRDIIAGYIVAVLSPTLPPYALLYFLLPPHHLSPNDAMPEYTVSGSGDAAARVRGLIHAQRHVRVICIGAGASGLLMAYKLQRHFSNYSLTVYEKNSELSGTWWENKYPGYVISILQFR